ncbi:MAG: hypothetical protein LBC20_17910 [Planctomycetaceae bacterium]|jgi:hypothetical protein|nr:hypothetical protein [Planctomycetaceae bacterium]
MNRVKTTFSSIWLFCLFCILQKIRYYYQERLHIDFSSNTTDNGELTDVELISVSWSGMSNNWNLFDDNTVLYRADKSITVDNRFVMNLVIPYAVTLDLKATAIPATITKADGTTVNATNASIGGW